MTKFLKLQQVAG